MIIVRLVSLCLGYGLLAVGVLGVILPVLHGTLFVVVGLALLAPHAPWARRLLGRLKAGHPRLRDIIDRGERLTRRGVRTATVRVGRLFRAARVP